MSELKSFIVLYDGKFIRAYEESEADKVIADKDKEIAELKKEKEYVIEHTAEVINGQEQEIRHSKYKRCLAMAKLCHWKMGVFIYKEEKSNFYHRWHNRWLAIAEKFKEAK